MDSVQDYNELLGVETLHPLVSVVDFSELEYVRHCLKTSVFTVFSSSISTVGRCSTGVTNTITGRVRWFSSRRARWRASMTARFPTDTRDGA